MAGITINLYNFPKRDNSTKRPTGTGKSYNGDFKTGFNLLSPVVKLYNMISPPNYNYAYIPSLSRYYFITTWRYLDGFWYADLSCDVLASWKTDIGNQTVYVTRSYSNFDGYIIDSAYPATGKSTIVTNTIAAQSEIFPGESTGCFIVGIVGGASSTGAISYYAFSAVGFQNLIAALLGDIEDYQIDEDDLSYEMQKAFINPSQYITSCLWIPCSVGNVPGSSSSVMVGWWDFGITATQISPMTAKVGGTFSLTIPKHPKAATRGKYLNLSPFSDYYVNFFPFGSFALDTTRLQDKTTLTFRYIMDCCTGDAVCYVVTDGNEPVKVLSSNFGVPVPTGQIAFQTGNFSSMATTAIGGAVAGASGHLKDFMSAVKTFWQDRNNPEAGRNFTNALASSAQASNLGSDIMSAAAASLANVDVTGHMGSNIYSTVPRYITAKFLDVPDDSPETMGRPCCKRLKINTLSGYLKCGEADISLPCTETEREIVIKYLLTGMYYE